MTADLVLHTVLTAGTAALLLIACLWDLAVRAIPNRLSLALLACGLAMRAIDGTPAMSLLACVLVFAAGVGCWRAGWLGGGDVKLLAASATAVPLFAVGDLLLTTAIAGSILALIYLALAALMGALPPASRDVPLLRRVLRAERWRIRRKGPLPYACAICFGVLSVLSIG